MKTSHPVVRCEQARPFYYDCLLDHAEEYVPAEVLSHVAACTTCHEETERLRASLSRDHRQPTGRSSAVLSAHLKLIGTSVSCAQARPFLPSLADGEVHIRIPTPVTVHVERCHACQEDLEVLRRWALGPVSIRRLTQVLVEGQTPRAIPEDSGPVDRGLSCDEVVWADLLDMAFPDGEDEPSPKASHTAACPRCKERLAGMTGDVLRMARRPASGVVTRYHVDPSMQGMDPSPGCEWPVRVEVETPKASERIAVGMPQRVQPLKWVRRLSAVAAVVVVAAVLVLSVHRAQAVSLRGLLGSLGTAGAVHWTVYEPDQAAYVREMWFFKALGGYIVRDATQTERYDLENRRRSWVQDGGLQTSPMPEAMVRDIRDSLDTFGLSWLLSAMPADADMKVLDAEVGSQEDIQILQAEWSVASGQGRRRLQAWVDQATQRPVRMEFYIRLPGSTGFELESVLTVAIMDPASAKALFDRFPDLPKASSIELPPARPSL